jgi:2-polyprenyl-6-methoxyphenol hydroxylase-like FAD-dependent oxidoreductase
MASFIVVGGSLGGLLAANMLLRAGHQVTLLERSSRSLEGRGAGIVTHDSLRDALRAAGAVVDATLGVPVDSRVVLGLDGRTEHAWAHPQVLTSWTRLYKLLCAALPAANHRLGAPVVDVSQDENGVEATLADGSTLQADLLIAADGIRSGVRAKLAPGVQPVYAGYVAWRGVCDETSLSRLTRQTLFDHFGFGIPDGEQMIGYPVAGADDGTTTGQRRWNFVWYRPAAEGEELADLLSDADGQHYPEGIAPHLVSWRKVRAVREAARERLAPQFAEIVEKTAVPFLQPIYDLVSERLAFGRIALLGDAAFVARPHVGMGVTKAGDDALALAQAIASHGATPAALQAYADARIPASLAVVERGRQLGAYLEARTRPGVACPARTADQRAVAAMRQTAIDPRLFASEVLPFEMQNAPA